MSGLEIIGLVSGIISFIDFAAEGVALAQSIAEDGSASLDGNTELEDRIKRCDNQMNSIRRDYSDIEKNSHETELVKVTDEYRFLTLELMSLLGGLRATRKRDIAFKLFKSSRQKDKKAELPKDLEACRQRVHMQLTLATSADLQQRLEEIRDQGKAKSTEVKLMRDGISELETRMKAWRHVPEFMEQAAYILAVSKGATERTAQALILEKLHVADMTRRFDDVKPAHEKTFSWILESEARTDETLVELNARQDLTTWLSKGRGVFHITGKPGAGKSTLMKLLCQSCNTEDQLKIWTGNRSLIMANFFFYQHGTPLQKSLEGLKQALLCSILEQVPCLVEKVFPQLWSCAIQQMPIEVRPSYVEAAFTELFNSPDFFTSNVVVFFIDGLDEFVGEHQAIVDLLLSWVGRYPTNIKICVSSREWVVFTRAFVHSPKIKLHEITFRDIQSFVRHKLADLISSTGDSIATERARSLINQIIDKAEGVFLWVRIVVEGLISSPAAGDLMEDLEERVNDLPKELENLYENIFKSMANESFATRKDRKKAMRMLLATIPSHSPRIPMVLIRHLFLEEYEKNHNFALDLPIPTPQIDAASRDQRLYRTHRAVYRRCMGLLEVYTAELDDFPRDHGPRSTTKQSGSTTDETSESDVLLDFEDEEYFHSHVSYKDPSKINQYYPSHQQVRCIHRTALEFLRQHEVNKTMRADATDDMDFNEGDFHCQSYLAAIKYFRPSVFYVREKLSVQLRGLLSQYHYLEKRLSNDRWMCLFEELGNVIQHHNLHEMEINLRFDLHFLHSFYPSSWFLPPKVALLLLSMRAGIYNNYNAPEVWDKILSGQDAEIYEGIVLDNFLTGTFGYGQSRNDETRQFKGTPAKVVSERILAGVDAYLKSGALSSAKSDIGSCILHGVTITCWHAWLMRILVSLPREAVMENRADFITLFLTYGADTDIWVKFTDEDFIIWWPGTKRGHFLVSNISRFEDSEPLVRKVMAPQCHNGTVLHLRELLPIIFPEKRDQLESIMAQTEQRTPCPPPDVWEGSGVWGNEDYCCKPGRGHSEDGSEKGSEGRPEV
ncbi:hypothetical protein CGCSCA1_v006686 [Colletotrichum siamense]|nr:hypothetical protein CGCSCA1_v006686 [Colletotrichum siamense]